jgi:hypothetical protein
MAFPITELRNTFGYEISKQVIENMDTNFILRWIEKPEFFDNPIEMLSTGFVWEETPQGHDYWLEITGKYSMENN